MGFFGEILYALNRIPGWLLIVAYSLAVVGVTLLAVWHPIYEAGRVRGNDGEVKALRRENEEQRRVIEGYRAAWKTIKAAVNMPREE